MDQDQFSVSLLVANQYGVLTRVAALFARRGFNIDSLTVGETENTKISRMTITAKGDDYIKDQIVKQLEKLEDVKLVVLNDSSLTALRELLMIKVSLKEEELAEFLGATDMLKADVVNISDNYVVLQITDEPSKLDAFIELVQRKNGIVELSRTGPTAMGKGEYNLSNF